MKYRYTAWYFRLLAFVLAAVCLGFGFISGMGAAYCASEGFYFGQEQDFQTTWRCSEAVRTAGREIIDRFLKNPGYRTWEKWLRNTDLRFMIVDESDGAVVASYTDGLGIRVPDNMAGNPYLFQYNHNLALGERDTFLETIYVSDHYFGTDEYGNPWSAYSSENERSLMHNMDITNEVTVVPAPTGVDNLTSYQILYLLPQTLSRHEGDPIWEAYEVYLLFWNWRQEALILFAACLLGFLASMIFLLVTAGRRPGLEEIHAGWVEKLPGDVLLVLAALAGVGIIAATALAVNNVGYDNITVDTLWPVGGLCAVGTAVCGTFVLAVLRTCVVRLRLRCFWKSMWIVRLLCWLLPPLFRLLGRGFRSMGLVPRAAAAILGVFLVEGLLLLWMANTWNPALPMMALIVCNMALLGALFWAVAQMKILQDMARTLAEGNLEEQVELGQMYWDFKRHGESLNAIADGMNRAVEQRMKSERLKTELITNVSHDIKTPLTSIINYVDLLQKPHTEEEGVQFLEVLNRQAQRLKKLTENLVEASKASTGNLPVELQPTSMTELLHQAVEEYRDRLEAGKLEVVMALEGDLTALADGKHLWRILDNLLSNVAKYALPGTRVYITSEKRADRVVIAVKNISRDALNVSAEDLMERFVRGDSSRATEGSGLGLSIARSLTTLQNGEFNLTVDGDFFKAEVSLPAV